MSETAVTTRAAPSQAQAADIIERAVIKGDLSGLTAEQRVQLVRDRCAILGLTWETQPFDFLKAKGENGSTRTILYARADCARQLAKRDSITLEIVSQAESHDAYVVHVRATAPAAKGGHKRTDEDVGVVALVSGKGQPLKGDDRANAIKRAVTQAKRRAVLSICGLGIPDESEVESFAATEPVRQVEVRTVQQPAPVAIPQSVAAVPGQPVNASLPVLDAQIAEIVRLRSEVGFTSETWKTKLGTWGVTSAKQMTQDQAAELVRDLQSMLLIQGLAAPLAQALAPEVGGDGLPNNPPPARDGGQPNGAAFRQSATAGAQ